MAGSRLDSLKLCVHSVRMRQTIFAWMALGLCTAPVVASDLRIEHVTVVSPELSSPLQDATVIIRGDRIVAKPGMRRRFGLTCISAEVRKSPAAIGQSTW